TMDQVPDALVEVELRHAVDPGVQSIYVAEESRQVETVADDHESGDDIVCRPAREILQAGDEGRSATVDDVVGQMRGDDLAAQAMALDLACVFLLHLLREII